jgi:hypothetical protein
MNDYFRQFRVVEEELDHGDGPPSDTPPKSQKRSKTFTKLLHWWRACLIQKDWQTWYIATVLLDLIWRDHCNPVVLGNTQLLKAGISRKVKYRVLEELEEYGLVRVTYRLRKAPLVWLVLNE